MSEDQMPKSYMKAMADYADSILPVDKQSEYVKKFQETGNLKYQDILIVSNLRYVYNIAKKYNSDGMQVEDLMSAGCRGMMIAMDKYESHHGASFLSYASWWIKQQMRKEMIKTWSVMRMPSGAWSMMHKIKKLHKKGKTLYQIAEECETRIDTVRFFIGYQSEYSLDAKIGDEDSQNMEDLVGGEDEEYTGDLMKLMLTHIEKLTEREMTVIKMRYGIGYSKTHTLDEVAQVFGRTRERIRQIQNQALSKLRKKLGNDNRL